MCVDLSRENHEIVGVGGRYDGEGGGWTVVVSTACRRRRRRRRRQLNFFDLFFKSTAAV